jgi:hypothetical protein
LSASMESKTWSAQASIQPLISAAGKSVTM